MQVSKRKFEHIQIALEQDVHFKNKTPGFEAYQFIHCALPEMNFGDVCTETEFLGKKLTFPLMITAITGGYPEAVEINRQLAVACQEKGIAMGVGSQRQILEDDSYLDSYGIVRKTAPDCVIIGNIGAEQVAEIKDLSVYQRMIDLIEADAMAVHLNPLQELLQPEGRAKFKGVLAGIERLVEGVKVPIIVKEIGCGISETVAKALVDIGIVYIDVAGAGGTSWAGIESFRETENHMALKFWDWGIPTAKSLEMVSRIPGVRMIASGGIDNGIVMAKALALGAELCGGAMVFLRVLRDKKVECLISLLRLWQKELQVTMFLTGSRKIRDLRGKGVIEKWDSTNGLMR